MKRLLAAVVLLSAITFAQSAIQKAKTESTGERVTVIRAGTLIDPHSGNALHNQVIVVRGNKIVSVGAANAPAGAQVIDLSRATVLPGLIDTHTHIFLQGEDPAVGGYDIQLLKPYASYRAARAIVAARRALDQGFTTLRDLGTEGAGFGDVGIRQAIEDHIIPGPRLFVAGTGTSTTGGYPLEDYNPDVKLPKGVIIADGPVELRRAAREELDHGVDVVKVYMTHRSWAGPKGELISQPTLTVEELKAVVDEAHGWGKKVACHTYGGIGLRRALDGGCDSIEHGLDLDDAAIAQMKRQGTWYVPTLSVYYHDNEPANTPEGQRDLARINAHERSFKKAMQAGVKIAFGTDMGGIDWKEPIAQEFTRMTGFGMSPADAIRTATVNAAELLDMTGKIGTIAPGAFADIIAVSGDPLRDPAELGRVQFVMKDGEVFKNELK
jgi:imidazolonepropionase-like amidohydrolase